MSVSEEKIKQVWTELVAAYSLYYRDRWNRFGWFWLDDLSGGSLGYDMEGVEMDSYKEFSELGAEEQIAFVVWFKKNQKELLKKAKEQCERIEK